MDKYTATSSCLWVEGIKCNGSSVTSESLVEDIQELQAVVEAARELSKEWSRSESRLQLLAAISNVQPKTIQQLQDERNSAADQLAHYTIRGMSSSDSLDKYEAAKAAHEAALAKQTGG